MKLISTSKTRSIEGGGSFFGFLTVAVICATIAYLGYLYTGAEASRTVQNPRLWVPIVVETNGSQTALGETRQMEFWTPSIKTHEFLHKTNDDYDAKEKWQVIASEDVLAQFGMMLHTNQNVFGYRRIEVIGQGRTTYKPGLWWTITVSTNFSAGDLTKMYRTFWKSAQPVMVEVVDNRGTDLK